MILAFAFVNTSCSKKESEDLTNNITVNDLLGDWHFQSLEFEGKVYEADDDFIELSEKYDFVRISFLDVTTTKMDLRSLLSNNTSASWYGRYTLSRNTISFQDWFEFHIENWETFDGSVLIIKLLKSSEFSNTPIGGIYTMIREEPI